MTDGACDIVQLKLGSNSISKKVTKVAKTQRTIFDCDAIEPVKTRRGPKFQRNNSIDSPRKLPDYMVAYKH